MRSFDEKNGLAQAPFAAHHSNDVRRGPLSTAFATGVAALAVRRDGGKSRPLKPQFQACRNAPHYVPHATNGLPEIRFERAFPPSWQALEDPSQPWLA
jgi:hypothetical protein